jgi:hypothetical protein
VSLIGRPSAHQLGFWITSKVIDANVPLPVVEFAGLSIEQLTLIVPLELLISKLKWDGDDGGKKDP